MSLDVYLQIDGKEVYSRNITHNLVSMAEAAGIYKELWRPDEIGIVTAQQLIDPLYVGLMLLVLQPSKFEEFNAQNGWGTWQNFVGFVANYLEACKKFQSASIRIRR